MEPHYVRSSQYVAMRDGVRLAIDLFRPRGVEGPLATVLVNTRYGRRTGLRDEAFASLATVPVAILVCDARGTGASFGSRASELGPDEMSDMRELIDWIAQQPWSDGRVVAMGNSYSGDASDMILGSRHPRLVGAVSRFTEFDAYAHLMFPGGVRNAMMLREWGKVTGELDAGGEAFAPDFDPAAHAHLAPVDGDEDFRLLRAAIREHGANHRVDRDVQNCEFRDDELAPGLTFDDVAIFRSLEPLETIAVPSQYFGSWLDGGTADSALRRFASTKAAPMEVFIGAWSHGGMLETDPFGEDGGEPSMPCDRAPYDETADFLRRLLRGEARRRVIHYRTLGAEGWRQAARWPPPHTRRTRLWLGAQGDLCSDAPNALHSHLYDVDFTCGTGMRSRWFAQMGATPRYEDRRKEDERALVFTSAPMGGPIEITGTPEVCLRMAFDTSDAAVFAYLSCVAPDGRSTYLTEGQLRVGLRTLGKAPYECDGPWPTCWRSDYRAVRRGELYELRFRLFPVSAWIPVGHCIRLSIAGADADTFARYPATGPATFSVVSGPVEPSWIDLSTAPWPTSDLRKRRRSLGRHRLRLGGGPARRGQEPVPHWRYTRSPDLRRSQPGRGDAIAHPSPDHPDA